ncbi:MAG: ACT domain-containing protein [Caldiserica bacterium]|nr:ACT domain-containing protein [Caldisericota bacterium]
MERVRKEKEIRVVTKNKVGMLAEITEQIFQAGVNIENICAYATGEESLFYLITSDNEKVKSTLSQKGYQIEERNVVVLSLENRPGALSEVAEELKKAGINLNYIYATTSEKAQKKPLLFYPQIMILRQWKCLGIY